MTEADALAEVMDLAEADSYPKLTEAKCLRLLRVKRRVRVFTPNMICAVGDLVIPASADPTEPALWYVALSAGRAAAEPVWPEKTGAVTSGSVDFNLLGVYDGCAWDLRGAVRRAWEAKAAAVANKFDFLDAGQQLMRDQLHQHCLEQAALYAEEVWAL